MPIGKFFMVVVFSSMLYNCKDNKYWPEDDVSTLGFI